MNGMTKEQEQFAAAIKTKATRNIVIALQQRSAFHGWAVRIMEDELVARGALALVRGWGKVMGCTNCGHGWDKDRKYTRCPDCGSKKIIAWDIDE